MSVKLAWIGTYSFLEHMAENGYEATFIRLKSPRVLGWDEICEEAGFIPDAVVYSDRSFPPPLLGVESYPCPTCFYVVDSHIHDWYPAYAEIFDCCAVSLKNHVQTFADTRTPGTTIWLPPYPREADGNRTIRERWDVSFVGTVNPETTPKRAKFLEELEALLPGVVNVETGAYQWIFANSRIVLNIAERGDLNFRVFEALACGACLLTPAIEHGQDELFESGRCLETYENLNAEDAAAKIKMLLADPARCEALRVAGRAEIEKKHRMKHRAKQLADLLDSAATRGAYAKRISSPKPPSNDLRLLYLHWAESIENSEMRAQYLLAARSVMEQQALARKNTTKDT